MKLFFGVCILAVVGVLHAKGLSYLDDHESDEDDDLSFYDVPLFKKGILSPIIDLIEHHGTDYVTLPYRVQTARDKKERLSKNIRRVYKIYYFNISAGPRVEICNARVVAPRFPSVEKIFCEEFIQPEQTFFAGRNLAQSMAGQSTPVAGRRPLPPGQSPKPLYGNHKSLSDTVQHPPGAVYPPVWRQ
ncbi:hypothetical protein LSTR_LSTR010350 [Laodelphax striatellus]|uniref:Uncharacterized protein n=1 Tax=Laodelphax striatellus TaxID=195883 RepID=A0A482X123_LAOST|nr:hypothetical protein LSTR_LSTR010350 [Laodelphax striatellus]